MPVEGRERPPTAFWRAVPALGLAQVIGWGTLYYPITVLAGSMEASLRLDSRVVFGAFTMSLVVSGLCAPVAGRLIDQLGGRRVLSAGSLLAAMGLTMVALAREPVFFLAGWAVSGVAMAACLYDALFGALHRMAGTSLRRGITAITIMGGFASTAFWPLTHWLDAGQGWRTTLMIYAALHVVLCLPIHARLLTGMASRAPQHAADASPEVAVARRPAGIASMATAFALAAFVGSAVSAHLVEILGGRGLSADEAILVGAVIGPMQVLGRVVELAASRWSRPVTAGTVALALTAMALAALWLVHGMSFMVAAFAVLYGSSYGVMTIVRGTVPAELFGRSGYGALLGRLARPAFAAKAAAPVAFSLAMAAGLGIGASIAALVGIAVAALVAYQVAMWQSHPTEGRAKMGAPRAQ